MTVNEARAFVLEGDVVTMDRARPRAEAVGVRDGRIVAVGTPDEVGRAMGGGARIVALGGATVMPGFIDAHHHYCFAALDRRTADLHHAPGAPLEQLLSQVGEIARQDSSGWVRCQGYDPAKLRERRPPRLEELDEECPDRPLFLWAFSAHESCLILAGCAAMGWTGTAPDPDGGVFVRDRRGRLTGEVVESAFFLAAARLRG